MKRGILVSIVFGFFVTAVIVHGIIFGTALLQHENHFGILVALPKVSLTNAVRVDDQTYIARQPQAFITEMEKQGYVSIDRMGGGFIFEKNGTRYFSYGRMYSRLFMLFSYPRP